MKDLKPNIMNLEKETLSLNKCLYCEYFSEDCINNISFCFTMKVMHDHRGMACSLVERLSLH